MRNHAPPLLTELLSCIASPRDELVADGALLARTLNRLVGHEVEAGGPYALTPGGTHGDPDLGLNAAVAVFLGLHGVRLPNLDAFIDERIAAGAARSAVLDDPTLAALLEQDRRLREAPAPEGTSGPSFDAHETAVLDALRRAAGARFADLPDAFAENALEVIERTMRGNPDKQMSLMTLYMRDALGEKGNRFSDDHLAEFGLANVFFWTAFIIYDDFWDEDEAAEPRLLPVANLFTRHYVRFFETLLPHESGFAAFFHGLMDKLDAANEWEMLSCRLERDGSIITVPEQLPDYGDYTIKFYPAAGHVLGPVAMLVELGYAPDSAEAEGLIDYFKHYLIAMQLNDDAHDWKEDLARGHISTAVALLLKAWKDAYPERTDLDLVRDMPELERLFWFEALVPLCESVLLHTGLSERVLGLLASIEHPEPLREFIGRNEAIATKALREQRKSTGFLEALNV
ncbi:MAG: hypothetical protein QOE22_330 [Candidatus Parcubacteria bacterium]|jgi:hypothetical protein|nr:hypothetical protein [Candidatus Parcubacteria bacterium]